MKRSYLFVLLFFMLYGSYGQQWGIEGVNLQRAVIDGKVNSVWEGMDMPHGFAGKDVIIGVTDWGFDFTHPVFYDTSLTQYRILRAWDQYRNGGTPPEGFDYGVEIIGKDALLAAQCDTSNVYGYGYHGTHVASIAGGSGGGSRYRGVACEADFLFVTIGISEQAIEDAFRWMYKVAQEEQKRLVINMSWGLYYMGNMDGTGKMANLIDSLSSLGVVFVSSAGNNGDVDFHLGHTFSEEADTLKSFVFQGSKNDAYWGQSISMINTANTSFSFGFQIFNFNMDSVLEISPFYNTEDGDYSIDTFLIVRGIDTIFYNAFVEKSNQYNNCPQVRFRIKADNKNRTALIVAAKTGNFHAWNLVELTNDVGNWGGNFGSGGLEGWTSGDKNHGIGAPSHVESVITVAAHAAKFTNGVGEVRGGNIANFSCFGPTVDNRAKPDISAPGENIIAALSSFTNRYSGSISSSVIFNGKTYQFIAASGTSMSSPFVAGVAALVLQANPKLSSEQVKEILTQTAYSDEYTEQHGIMRFGHGKVDAYQAVLKALETVGVSDFQTENLSFTVYPNPTFDLVYISVQADNQPINVQLYDLSGRLLLQKTIYSGANTLDVNNLSAGCYILKLSHNHKTWTKKIIKQ